MKKRLLKKQLKTYCFQLLNHLDSSIPLVYHGRSKPSTMGFFNEPNRKISLNLKLKMETEKMMRKIGLSLIDSIEITITHEYCHLKDFPKKEWYEMYHSLFSNYASLCSKEAWQVTLKWREHELKEENRAWNGVRGRLLHINQLGLEKYIRSSLSTYEKSVQEAKDMLKWFEEFEERVG